MPSTARALLADATERLRRAGVPSPEVDAELLLAHVSGQPRAIVRMAGDVPGVHVATFEELVTRRAARIPLQHLTGRAPFRYLELSVGPGVFVPRPETELAVDLVRAHLAGPEFTERPDGGLLLVDRCTGSGALALSLATELGTWWAHAGRATVRRHRRPATRVVAVEMSPEALGWAARNVTGHAEALAAADSEVELIAADATTAADPGGPLAGLRGRVHVVVTNPPYVPDTAVPRDPEVREHDPALALFGGPDGLHVIRGLVRQAAALLHPGGLLVIEHADVQGEDAGPHGVPGLLRAQRDPSDGRPPWRDVHDHLDLTGLPRFTSALRCGPERSGATPSVPKP